MKKKLLLLLVLLMPFLIKATNYTSVANGNWSSSSTWSPSGVPGSGDNVTIANTVTLDANESVNSITINSSKTFTVSGTNSLTVYSNFTNNGIFTAAKGTISFNGSANQVITGSGSLIFENLVIDASDTVFMSKGLTVDSNLTITAGALHSQTYQITGNSTGTFSMAAGTTLLLGLPSSSAYTDAFPTNYTTVSLNTTSTVIYQANSNSQGLSYEPTYGNLVIGKAEHISNAYVNLTVNGYLTILAGAELYDNSPTSYFEKNITIDSGGSFVTGAAVNYIFAYGNIINNGTLNASNGNNFYLSSAGSQTISGPSSHINYYFNSFVPAATDTAYIEANISTGGSPFYVGCTVFVPSTCNDTIEIHNNLYNEGTFTALGGVVYFNGGGTLVQYLDYNSSTFNKLTTACAFQTLCNSTVKSDYTCNLGSLNIDGYTMTLGGNLINNATVSTTGAVVMNGSHNQTIGGSHASTLQYLLINTAASSDTVKLGDSLQVTNGNFEILNGTFDVTTNNYPFKSGFSFTNNGTFVPRNGTVTLNGNVYGKNEILGGTSVTTFNNLVLYGGTTVTLGNNAITKGNLIISGGVFDVTTSNYSVTIGGNFTNNSTFTSRSGTVIFNGSANQTLGGSTATTFNNLTVNSASNTDSLFLNKGITVNNNLTQTQGVLDCENYQITGNTSGTYSMASGTSLLLGSPASSSNVAFPNSFTGAHTTLNISSTVAYQANSSSQIISTTPTYGNLFIGKGTAAPGNTLAIGGNLITNSSATLSATTYTVNLTGNAINNGTLSFSTGALNIGGSFTNNGTFTAGTGTITFNGGNDNSINNTSGTLTFNNLTQNLAASTDTLFLNTAITVSNTVTQTQGTLNCQQSAVNNVAFSHVTVAQTAGSICNGNTDTLRATGYTTYVWAPTTGLSASTGATVVATPSTNTIYTLYAGTSSNYRCYQGKDTVDVSNCGNTCSYATVLSSCSGTTPIRYLNTWYSFTATGNTITILVHNLPDTLAGRITRAVLYSGTCGSLDSITGDTYHIEDGDGDSLINIHTGIIIGNTYYIKVVSDEVNTGRTFNLCLEEQNATATCSTTTCDIVSNGDFEAKNACPMSYNNIVAPPNVSDVSCWQAPDNNIGDSPDYFNSCAATSTLASIPSNNFGYTLDNIPGHSGSGYAGIYAEAAPPHGLCTNSSTREYLEEPIQTPMIANATYDVSYWVQLAGISAVYVDAASMGLFISQAQPTSYYYVYKQLEDPDNSNAIILSGDPRVITAINSPAFNTPCTWVNITGTYVANSHEGWITIGNFSDYNYCGSPSSFSSCPSIVTQQTAAYYYIDAVHITQQIQLTTPPAVTICSGSSTTLTASGVGTGGTYSWSPATGLNTSTGATVIATPTATTTYVVTGTNTYSCTSTETVVVTVTATPTVSIMQTGTTPFCAGGSVVLTASGSTATYTWAPSIGLTPSTGSAVTVSPTNTVTYTVTADNSGCEATATITVDATPTCCSTAGALYTWDAITGIPAGTYTTNSPIIISGTVALTGDVTFAGCPDIQMAARSMITVPPGVTLNITNSGSTISRLYACGNMWWGIVVDPGTSSSTGSLIVNGGSILEDADTAIYAPITSSSDYPPTISLDSVILNNNYFDIYIDKYTSSTNSSLYPLSIQRTHFMTGTDGGYSAGPYLKAPHASQITSTGIYLNDVIGAGIQIGTIASNARNVFNIMNYGIAAATSNFYVYHNEFTNLYGNTGQVCAPCSTKPVAIGIGVLAKGTNEGVSNTAVIGGGANYERNDFTTVYRGVDITNYENTYTYNNIFSNTSNIMPLTAQQIGAHGVYIKNMRAEAMEIDSNSITNFVVGIEEDRTYIGNNSQSYQEDIKHNEIGLSGSSSGMNTGILVENTAVGNYAPTVINFNSVTDAGTCIWVRNFKSQKTLIDSNANLRIVKYQGNQYIEHSGIRIENCLNNITVQNNPEIYSSNTFTTAPTINDTDIIGIYTLHSTGLIENCNTIWSVGECMRFSGVAGTEIVRSNEFGNLGKVYDGLVLWNNSTIGYQGTTGTPSGNQWHQTTPSSFLRYETYANYSSFNHSHFYVISSTTEDPAPNYGQPTAGALGTAPNSLNTTTGTAQNCGTIPVQCVTCMFKYMEDVVLDSLSYPIDSVQTDYIYKQSVYENMARYDTIAANDSILNSFYVTTSESGNIGKLHDIDNDIKAGNYGDANSLLSAFTPTNAIENNYKTVDSIYIYTIGASVDTLDSLDLVHLYNIAYQCPDLGGMGVYQARAMLNLLTNSEWEFSDSCTVSGVRDGHKPMTTPVNNPQPLANLNAKVYPNPANSLLNIEVQLPRGQIDEMCMYNSLGERVICEQLTENITILPINTLAQGIYYYRITTLNGTVIKADKVMIIH